MAGDSRTEMNSALDLAVDAFADRYFSTVGVVSVQDSHDGGPRIAVEVQPSMLARLRSALPSVWQGYEVVVSSSKGYAPQGAR